MTHHFFVAPCYTNRLWKAFITDAYNWCFRLAFMASFCCWILGIYADFIHFLRWI